jgi:hypothetical protein
MSRAGLPSALTFLTELSEKPAFLTQLRRGDRACGVVYIGTFFCRD